MGGGFFCVRAQGAAGEHGVSGSALAGAVAGSAVVGHVSAHDPVWISAAGSGGDADDDAAWVCDELRGVGAYYTCDGDVKGGDHANCASGECGGSGAVHFQDGRDAADSYCDVSGCGGWDGAFSYAASAVAGGYAGDQH